MKLSTFKFACVALMAMGFSVAQAQLPKLPKPKVTLPGAGSVSGSDVGLGGKDPSGLFSNITDDPSARVHRQNIVANLETGEAEYKKASPDYAALTKLMFEMDRTYGHIMKLEPKVNAEKFNERYQPLKARADKENAVYAEAQKLELLFDQQFDAPADYKEPNFMSFRTEAYSGHKQCYCRNYSSETKTLAEFDAAKKQYDDLTKQLQGYSHAETQKRFANMDACIANGNKYAIWACKTNLTKEVVEFAATKQAAEPKQVINRCTDYLAALERLETDNSLRFDAASLAAFTEAKATVNKTKADAETYISSGRFQQYLDKEHAAAIAKVFLPKAKTKNATLEAGAMEYIKSVEYAEYLGSDIVVASTVRAVTLTLEPIVHKNEYGFPEYQYDEIWVAFKDKAGKCYRVAVYASYTYKGGGTYAQHPTWGADSPDEMACDNVSK